MKTSLVSALRKTHSGISYQFEGAFPVDILEPYQDVVGQHHDHCFLNFSKI